MSEINVKKITFGTNGEQVQPAFTGFRNKIINGNFDVWQRAESQTSHGYGSDDRWFNGHIGSTKTHSIQPFMLGQTEVPGNPSFFSRTVVTSVAGANNYCIKSQFIESASTLAGKTATLSFWAKADATKNISVEFSQYFGTGGSPSDGVNGIGVTKILLSTTWNRYTVTTNIPSISGKVLGSNGNDYLQLTFWFEAGSDLNARTSSLGQQSGTFDIAQVQVEEGSVATEFEQRPFAIELGLCQRYYESMGFVLLTVVTGRFQTGYWKVTKRTAPTLTYIPNTGTGANLIVLSQGPTSGFSQNAPHSIDINAIVVGDAEL